MNALAYEETLVLCVPESHSYFTSMYYMKMGIDVTTFGLPILLLIVEEKRKEMGKKIP